MLQSSKDHVTPAVLEAFLELTQYLVKLPTGGVLLKHLFDYILFNPQLWVHTSVEVRPRGKVCVCVGVGVSAGWVHICVEVRPGGDGGWGGAGWVEVSPVGDWGGGGGRLGAHLWR